MNSVVLSLYDYSDRENETTYNKVINTIVNVFNGIFIFEFAVKIGAYGFINGKNTYLRSGWNCLDFIVVMSAILELAIKSFKFSGIRVIRAMRPLKSISAIPSMRKLVKTLIISLPNLGHVASLLSFIVVMFAILGLHLFNGTLDSWCRMTP